MTVNTGNKVTCVLLMKSLVATDKFGASQPDKVDATMAKQLTPQNAGTCMETCCKTYVPKGSNKHTVDGVNKLF